MHLIPPRPTTIDLEEIDETMIATMLTAAEDTLNPLIAEGEQQRAQLSGQLAAINEQEVQLQRAQQQVNAGWSQVSAGRQELAQAQTQIDLVGYIKWYKHFSFKKNLAHPAVRFLKLIWLPPTSSLFVVIKMTVSW